VQCDVSFRAHATPWERGRGDGDRHAGVDIDINVSGGSRHIALGDR